jgi:hypothetical protein
MQELLLFDLSNTDKDFMVTLYSGVLLSNIVQI